MKSQKALPNEPIGWVCRQTVRRGDRTYGPYWYRFWREGGRLRKAYVKARELKQVQEACAGWQAEQRRIRHERKLARESLAIFQELKRSLREVHGY